MPPGMSPEEAGSEQDGSVEPIPHEFPKSCSSDAEGPLKEVGGETAPVLDDVLGDLNAFDMANGSSSSQKCASKKQNASHKYHKKPEGKKDSVEGWNDDGDEMPVVRALQKPANTGPVVTWYKAPVESRGYQTFGVVVSASYLTENGETWRNSAMVKAGEILLSFSVIR